MDKKELIEAICKKEYLNSDNPIEAVGECLSFAYDEIFAAIVEAVAEGQIVEISGFGVFSAKEKEIKYVNHSGGGCFTTSFVKRALLPDFSPDLNFRDAVSDTGSRKP